MDSDMDLLIASFSSTAHISQEAVDLAALQVSFLVTPHSSPVPNRPF